MNGLVVISLEAWDQVWRRNQHLVHRLLRDDPDLRVLWVEPSIDPLHAIRSHTVPRLGRGLRRGPAGPTESDTRLLLLEPTKLLPRTVDAKQDERWARTIVKTAQKVGFRRPTLWVNDPRGAHVLEQSAWPAIYDITDDWLEADRPSPEIARLQQQESILLERCDEVVVCSPSLQRSKSGGTPTTLIPNAVDVAAYRRPRSRPADLPAGPTAVYVGTLHRDRLDVPLSEATARALANHATLTLVGPNLLPPDDTRRLEAAGARFLGAKPAAEVPGYLQHADVLVVPHVVNAFTDSLDPIKVYEYAAVGRPVVSTRVAGFRDSDDTAVSIAEGQEFVRATRDAVPASWHFPAHTDRPVPSWEDRATEMRRVLERVARGDDSD